MPPSTADRPDVNPAERDSYTVEDYRQLPEGAPYQLIRGHLVMSPSPSVRHQDIVLFLGSLLREHVQTQGGGRAFVAPMDVRLSDETVVQPDVLYVSAERTDRIGDDAIDGAPDFIVEVVSPSTSHVDTFDKKQLYETHGVREYWIVDPDTETVEVYTPGDDGYTLHRRCVEAGSVDSALLPDLTVALSTLFEE